MVFISLYVLQYGLKEILLAGSAITTERSFMMKEYEVFIETMNPCGGEKYGKKELIEVEAESPEAYVKENGRFPVLDTGKNSAGDTVITTGDGQGNVIRYTFTE